MKRVGRVETTENVDRWHIDHESIKVNFSDQISLLTPRCVGIWPLS